MKPEHQFTVIYNQDEILRIIVQFRDHQVEGFMSQQAPVRVNLCRCVECRWFVEWQTYETAYHHAKEAAELLERKKAHEMSDRELLAKLHEQGIDVSIHGANVPPEVAEFFHRISGKNRDASDD